MSKLSQITPILGYTKVSDELFLGRLNAVYSGTNGNPAYPNPPIDMNAFKADIDSYSGVITEALDGSKKAISEKKKKREALTKSLRLLGRYVEIMCKNDMPTFLSSAFSFGFVVFLLPFMSKFIEFLESLADFLHAFR